MEGELIFLGFIMLIGQIILLQMWNNNWFKKENFKIQKANVIAENRLKLKKLEKELGVTIGKTPKEPATLVEKIGGITDLLTTLEPDQVKALANKFLTRGDEEEYDEEEDEDLIGTLMKNVPEEAIKGFLEGIGKGGSGGQQFTGQV